MQSKQTSRSRLTSLISSGASWAAALLMAVSIGGLWFVRSDDPTSEAVPLATVLALVAVVGVSWQRSCARANSRFQAAMDAYAEREISRERHRRALQRLRALSAALGTAGGVEEHVKSRRLAS